MTSRYEDEQDLDARADYEADMAQQADAASPAAIGEDAAYTLGVQDRVRGLNMREAWTLNRADQNHYTNGYRDMSADLGQREAFTSYDQHGFLDSEWQR